MTVNFGSKFNYQRFYSAPFQTEDEYHIVRQFESDRGRIINSAPIRRLQQKTQVFPLERNAAVRSRLTHSLEVQQVGRGIAKEIIHRLKRQNRLEELGLAGFLDPFESIVEMACLMHDVGNPPFGHFGEAAINDWFCRHLGVNLGDRARNNEQCQVTFLRRDPDGDDAVNTLRNRICIDLCHFEGNAQTIRLLHSLLKLNLTYAQIACVLKYTRPAYWQGDLPDGYDYLMKKPGYYLSEEAFVHKLRNELGMAEFHRYPLTYIMEAADDISYCVADLEDAVEKNILTVEQLRACLEQEWGEVTEGDLFDTTVMDAYNQRERRYGRRSEDDVFFMYLRVNVMKNLVPHAAKRFVQHLPQIVEGSFNQALLEGQEQPNRLLQTFKEVAFRQVFNHPEVEELELQGYRVIGGLLDIYSPLLAMPLADFRQLVEDDRHRGYPIETRLFHKLSRKHRLAYNGAIEGLRHLSAQQQEIREYYYRARLIQDYISGMTDLYAYDEYRRLMAAE